MCGYILFYGCMICQCLLLFRDILYNGLGKHTLKQGIVRRIQTILIPTIIWNVIINVLTRNMNLYLWYLWSICFCNILVFSIAKTSKNKIVTFFLFTFFFNNIPYGNWWKIEYWIFAFSMYSWILLCYFGEKWYR